MVTKSGRAPSGQAGRQSPSRNLRSVSALTGDHPSRSDFTIADVLAWARTKPAEERYSYGDIDNCAICQFLRETGRAKLPGAGGTFWNDQADPKNVEHEFPDGLDRALVGATFGALVTRLEALCPDAPVPPSEWMKLDAYLTDIETVSA